jgi:periplasmic divalent cation tolerance protein
VLEILQVVTATDSRAEADRLAQGSVASRLAASAQVEGPLQSVYWWEGKATRAEEWRVTMKTAAIATKTSKHLSSRITVTRRPESSLLR